jgi:hypothetical protein
MESNKHYLEKAPVHRVSVSGSGSTARWPRSIGMTEITPATTKSVDHRAKLKTEIARLERKIKDKMLDIEFLQDQIEDLQIELQESED